MKTIVKVAPIYFITFLFFTLIYLSLFHTSLFSSQRVLFYRGLFLLSVTLIILFILAIFLSRKLFRLNLESLIAAILVSTSINLSFFVVLPVTFERSVTMYLLNTLKDSQGTSCQGLSKSQLEEKLINEYIIERKAIDKRANEQKIIGFIKEDNQCIQLTPKALNFLKLSELIGSVYGLK